MRIIALVSLLGVVAANGKYEVENIEGETISSGEHNVEHSGIIDGSKSALRTIAQGSADQAHSAVANQHAAAQQASFVAKSTLAQAAIQASATAQAALHGKEILLHSIEEQTREAVHALEEEIHQLQKSQESANAASISAQQAAHHVHRLKDALNDAKNVLDAIETAANEISSQLAEQTAMVGKAETHLRQLKEKLHSAQIDFEATKEAAEKAAASAQEAQSNANAAAEQVTLGSEEHHLDGATGNLQSSADFHH